MAYDPAVPALRRAVTRLGSRLRRARPRGGLSPNQLSVLGHLQREGPSTPGEIAAAERQQPQSLTRVFAELELRGHVSRTPSPRDGRQVIVEITAAGREALAADMRSRDAWLAERFATLTPVERQVLALAAEIMDRLAEPEARVRADRRVA